MIDIVLDKEYMGPDIFELAPVIPDITDTVIKLRWANTKDELRSLRQFPDRNFQLYVADAHAFDRATATFGKRLKISPGIIERARLTLNDPRGYDWRNFTKQLHDVSPCYLLLQMAADGIRKGWRPNLALIVESILVNGINAVDADVLLRLKSSRFRG